MCILHAWTPSARVGVYISLHGFPVWILFLPPRSTGQCLDLLRSALLRTTSSPSSFVPSSTEHRLLLHTRCLGCNFRSFVRSFVLLSARAPCRFGDFNARQFLFSRLSSLSSLAPLRFPIPPPHQITSCLLFRRARAFPFSSATYFPGQQVFFRRFSSRIYVCIYDVGGCRVRVQCLAPVISCGCARKNVESDRVARSRMVRFRGKIVRINSWFVWSENPWNHLFLFDIIAMIMVPFCQVWEKEMKNY